MSCPLAVAVIPLVVSFLPHPRKSAQNKNAEQARVASASLYPEQEGYADSNPMMLYYLSAGANARTPTWWAGGHPTITLSLACWRSPTATA
jgi:hypothetical protein